MGYIIGSFNTHNFGIKNHDINLIAEIIVSENFDIIALQEVISPKSFELLMQRLPPGWDGCCSKHGNNNQGFGSYTQGFGYLWKTKRVRVCDQPIIFSKYTDIFSKDRRMIRDPYYSRFTPSGTLGGAFFEIRLINIHLKANYDKSTDKPRTVAEYKKVTGEILGCCDKRYGDNMPAYTIILGDHNLLCVECNTINQQTANGIVTKQEEKTWICSDDPSKREVARYYSDLDHFSYEEARFDGTTIKIERVDSVSKYCSNDFKKHRESVSDHVPIKLELILN
jgi:hypothetical protein